MPLAELHRSVHDDPPKGEIVVLLDRSGAPAGTEGLDHALAEALQTMRTREAADTVSARLGLPRRLVYQAALRLSGKGPD